MAAVRVTLVSRSSRIATRAYTLNAYVFLAHLVLDPHLRAEREGRTTSKRRRSGLDNPPPSTTILYYVRSRSGAKDQANLDNRRQYGRRRDTSRRAEPQNSTRKEGGSSLQTVGHWRQRYSSRLSISKVYGVLGISLCPDFYAYL